MNSNPHNPQLSHSISDSTPHRDSSSGEETLRIIANLPAPAGLEDRVRGALRAAPHKARVLSWPRSLNPQSGWMRTAAAAAIVFVVVGGGWGVYTRVQHGQPAKVIVMPSRTPAGGFSSAGAMRTPDTIPGPVAPVQPKVLPAQPKAASKAAAQATRKIAPVAAGSSANRPN